MCFSLQRRAIFPHLNFQTWSENVNFLAFWLQNVLLATAACNFSTSQLQKVLRTWHALYIFTWKCASRHSGVQFLISPLTTWLRTRCFNEPTFRLTRHTNHWKTQRFGTSLTFGAGESSFFWLSRYCIFFLLTLLHLLTLLSCDFTSSICFSSAFQLSILSEVYYLNFLRSIVIPWWLLSFKSYLENRWSTQVIWTWIYVKGPFTSATRKGHGFGDCGAEWPLLWSTRSPPDLRWKVEKWGELWRVSKKFAPKPCKFIKFLMDVDLLLMVERMFTKTTSHLSQWSKIYQNIYSIWSLKWSTPNAAPGRSRRRCRHLRCHRCRHLRRHLRCHRLWLWHRLRCRLSRRLLHGWCCTRNLKWNVWWLSQFLLTSAFLTEHHFCFQSEVSLYLFQVRKAVLASAPEDRNA